MKTKTPAEILAMQANMRTSILACHRMASEIAHLIASSKADDDSEAALVGVLAGSVLISKSMLDAMRPETAAQIMLVAQIVEASRDMGLTPEQSADRCAAAVPESVAEIEAGLAEAKDPTRLIH